MEHKKLYNAGDLKREIPENTTEAYRHDFRRDYARLLHSPAFRRLQGKTQLFPGGESDFFRNRLTHSLEVAQIAKSIAIKINDEVPPFCDDPANKINEDLVEFAGLAHDLGHPPFGHNGEIALDECMKKYGGFEGNAQTLRILSRIEKKIRNEHPIGLNLTLRSLASILKYDQEIPAERVTSGVQKGYYKSEASLVKKIKKEVVGKKDFKKFKTIECSIMDIADDIAYSTYDLEDALKAGFMSVTDIISMPTSEPELFDNIAKIVWWRVKGKGKEKTDQPDPSSLEEIKKSMWAFFREIFEIITPQKNKDLVPEIYSDPTMNEAIKEFMIIAFASSMAKEMQSDGHNRTMLTSQLVGRFISEIRVKIKTRQISQSEVYFEEKTHIEIESLKNYTYQKHILSPRLKVTEFRGQEFVTKLFNALSDKKGTGYMNLPDDWKKKYLSSKDDVERARTVCDFIAGMTDRYALEFYGRLFSESPQTIFKTL